MEVAEQIIPSITFLNESGDITITWDKQNEEAMLALIEQKRKEGYTFFILKPRFGGLFGNKKVEVESIEQARQAGSVVANDALAKTVSMNLGDTAVSAAVAAGHAEVVPLAKERSFQTAGVARTAQEVVRNQTLATRPIVGG